MNTEKLFDLSKQELVTIDGGWYPPDTEPKEPWEIDWKDILGPIVWY